MRKATQSHFFVHTQWLWAEATRLAFAYSYQDERVAPQ